MPIVAAIYDEGQYLLQTEEYLDLIGPEVKAYTLKAYGVNLPQDVIDRHQELITELGAINVLIGQFVKGKMKE